VDIAGQGYGSSDEMKVVVQKSKPPAFLHDVMGKKHREMMPMPGNVTGPFMCGGTPPNYKYCPTCVFAEGKPLLGTCMMYPGGMLLKPNHVYNGKPCGWYQKIDGKNSP
ncbi:hypothetical protein, partial [Megasphaera massiliensis]|uniref:hypothetical protein n=3 Tax=Megasphaera TaxID=906 RepID=UPI003AF070B8